MTPEVAKPLEDKLTESKSISESFKAKFPAITALFTAALTFVVWFSQQKIEQKIDNNQIVLQAKLEAQQVQLQAHLALKEELYKRRLTLYEDACRQIADAQIALADVGTTDKSVIRATNLVNALDKLRRGHQLYWSKQVDGSLDKLWSLGICRVGSRPCELPEGKVLDVEALPQEITNAVMDLHEQMKRDLNILELAKALQEISRGSQETQ